MLQRTAHYALRVVVWLARDPGRKQTSRRIGGETQVPSRYLCRVLDKLTKKGMVSSQPGPEGGYALESDPDAITLLDVVRAIAPVERIRSCPLGLDSHEDLCPLHQHLDDTYADLEHALRRVTVGELVRARTRFPPLAEAKKDRRAK
jgi:Rrf2 family protein